MRAWSHVATAAEAQAYLSTVLGQSPLQMAVHVAAAGGAGALCDLDCYGSAASRSFGTGTEALSWAVAKAAHGHRNGTHTVIGDFVFAGAAALALALEPYKVSFPVSRHIPFLPATVAVSVGGVLLWLYLCLLFGAGLKAMSWRWFRHDHVREFWACAAASAVVAFGWDLPGITMAVLLGTFIHCAGDSITKEGVAWFEPFSRHRFHFGIPERFCITTGHWVERIVVDKLIVWGAAAWFLWIHLSAAFPILKGAL